MASRMHRERVLVLGLVVVVAGPQRYQTLFHYPGRGGGELVAGSVYSQGSGPGRGRTLRTSISLYVIRRSRTINCI